MITKFNKKTICSLMIIFDEDEDFMMIYSRHLALNRRIKNLFFWNSSWYDETLPKYNELQFKNAFRMTRNCLDSITKEFLEARDYNECYYNKKWIRILIYNTMHIISYRDLAEKFGEPTTTVFDNIQKYLREFISAMSNKYIRLPEVSEFPNLSDKFLEINQIIGTVLAIDGTHIPIQAPKFKPEVYVNRKGWHSLSFQIVVDANYIIRDVFGGYAGSCHDAYVFSNSPFYDYIRDLPDPYVVIGDAAYPSMDGLLTPFKGTLTNDQEVFNFRHSSQRMRVECTIGRLKGRFNRFCSASKNWTLKTLLTYFI